tara:strand:+ start:132 stop:347 length:216 start_codon:yes stop_codon:yes gene_type:complete
MAASNQTRLPMSKRYTLSFTRDQLLAIADALEGYHTHNLTPDELTAHDNVTRRVFDAVARSTGDIDQLVLS